MNKQIVCPVCGKYAGLVVYPKQPVLLHSTCSQHKGQPIVTDHTDVCCIECYWQGTVDELERLDAGLIIEDVIAQIKKRVNNVLDAPFGDKEDEEP